MEALQLAQMLADLSDLNAADPAVANSLVNANKSIANSPPQESTASAPQQHRRTPSASAVLGRTSTPGSVASLAPRTASAAGGASTPFDTYIGRRFMTPPVTRTSSSHGSLPGTPRGEAESDVDRASSFMALYELRAKLKQYNDSNSLRQARDKIAALSAHQHPHQHLHDASQPTARSTSAAIAAGHSTSPPQQPPPLVHRHTQYTYPRT